MAAAFQGASAELIQRLLDLRAPVDAVAERIAMTILARVLLTAKALQHRYGKDTPLSRAMPRDSRRTVAWLSISQATPGNGENTWSFLELSTTGQRANKNLHRAMYIGMLSIALDKGLLGPAAGIVGEITCSSCGQEK